MNAESAGSFRMNLAVLMFDESATANRGIDQRKQQGPHNAAHWVVLMFWCRATVSQASGLPPSGKCFGSLRSMCFYTMLVLIRQTKYSANVPDEKPAESGVGSGRLEPHSARALGASRTACALTLLLNGSASQ
jgi:hypothetical protein